MVNCVREHDFLDEAHTKGSEKKNVWRHLSKPEIPSLLFMKEALNTYKIIGRLGGHQKTIRGQRSSALRSKVETGAAFQ